MDEKAVRDALRRHLAATDRPRHMPMEGGIQFEEGGALHFAPDRIVRDVLAEVWSERIRRCEADRGEGPAPSCPDAGDATAALRRHLQPHGSNLHGSNLRLRLDGGYVFEEGGRLHWITDEAILAALADDVRDLGRHDSARRLVDRMDDPS